MRGSTGMIDGWQAKKAAAVSEDDEDKVRGGRACRVNCVLISMDRV